MDIKTIDKLIQVAIETQKDSRSTIHEQQIARYSLEFLNMAKDSIKDE